MKRRLSLILASLLLISTIGCSSNPQQVSHQKDILTQKKSEGKLQITVLVKHAFSINSFEKAVEEKFPDIDIVQVGNYTSALNPDEYVARMKHDDLTDIVMTWPLDFGEEYFEDRLLDLSSYSFTTKYNVSMLDTIQKDGKLYYLPGPAQIRGLVYNKTLFEENGWEVPKNYDEFIELCTTIESTGIRAIQLGFKNPEVLDTAFIGFSYGSSFATPKDNQWIQNYSQGNGNFLDHFETALTTFQDMIDLGIWKKEDLDIDYSQRENIFFSRQSAMIEDSVLIARSGFKISGNTDEFALMPFFNPGGAGNDWARLYMVCYIGLNKHLADTQNKNKLDAVLEIMDYISTPEGQEALAADTGAMYSSLKDVPPIDVAETRDIVDALAHGRYGIFKELPNIQGTLREGLAKMLTGELNVEQVGALIDEANRNQTSAAPILEILGTATRNFSLLETGNFITDTMKNYTSSDIALFLDGGKDGRYNSKGVTAKMYEGDITTNDIKRILPDFKYGEKGELQEITMTGENLINTLEYSIPVDNDQTGWFYYFSGLKMKYDPTNEPGSRIEEIKLADGTDLDLVAEYTITIIKDSIPSEYIISSKNLDLLLGDLLEESIRNSKVIEPSTDNRFIYE